MRIDATDVLRIKRIIAEIVQEDVAQLASALRHQAAQKRLDKTVDDLFVVYKLSKDEWKFDINTMEFVSVRTPKIGE